MGSFATQTDENAPTPAASIRTRVGHVRVNVFAALEACVGRARMPHICRNIRRRSSADGAPKAPQRPLIFVKITDNFKNGYTF